MCASDNLLLHHSLVWCRRWSITSSWSFSTNVSWYSSASRALVGYRPNAWWEIPSLTLDDMCYRRQPSCLPSYTNVVHVLCCPSSSLLIQLMSPSTLEYYYLVCQECRESCTRIKNSWYSNTSCHHHSFLGPVLFLTGIPTNELWCVVPILLSTLSPWG